MQKVTNKMKKSLLIYSVSVVAGLTFGISAAQAQETPYQEIPAEICLESGSAAVSIDTDSNGNIYAAVQSDDDNGSLVKCSPRGALLWKVEYDGTNKNPVTENLRHESEGISAVVVGDDDNVYITGDVYQGTNMHDCMTKKISSDGDVIWQSFYDKITFTEPYGISGPDLCKDLDIDNARGYIVVGGLSAGPSANDNYSGLLLKYDLNGALLANENNCNYGLPCMSQYVDISISPFNGVVNALSKYDFNAHSLGKFRSTNLTPIDAYHFPASSFIPTAIAADHKGNVFVGGSDMGTGINDGIEHVYHKIALYHQPSGQLKEFCSSNEEDVVDLEDGLGCHLFGEIFYCPEAADSIRGITLLPDPNKNQVVVTGGENLTTGSVIRTMVYDENCDPQWDVPMDHYAGGDINRGSAIAIDAEENLAIAGESEALGVSDATILKYGLKCENFTDMTSCAAAFSGCKWLSSAENGICVEGF